MTAKTRSVIVAALAVMFCTGAAWAGTPERGVATSFDSDVAVVTESSISVKGERAVGDLVDLDASMQAGAEYLRKMQADSIPYEDNAGNGSNPDVPDDPDDGGWDWRVTAPAFSHTTGASSPNLYGATAQGLYYAYLEASNPTHLVAMTDAATAMVDDPDIDSGGDLVFLMLYSDLVADTAFADSARAKYDLRIAAYSSAQAFAEYIRDFRAGQGYENGIIAWDIGVWARAAAMLDARYPGNGYDTDANDIAEVIYQDSFSGTGYFDLVRCAGWDPMYAETDFYWYTLGLTGLIDAFDASGLHTDEIPGLVTKLLASQYPGGAISYCYGAKDDDEDWQATAYAMMTLGNLCQVTYQAQINRMGYWVGATQDASGGWVYGSGNHYPEVGGECTAGLYFTSNDVCHVLVDGSFTSQADVDTYNTDHVTSYVWGYDAFATIQDGLDAVNGSTVQVAAGNYPESFEVSKAGVSIIGAGIGVVTIDATGKENNGAGIYVSANDVTLQGFTLKSNGSDPPRYGIKFANVSGGAISDVRVQDIYRSGFDFLGTSNTTVMNIESIDNGGHGISLVDCNNISLTNILTSDNGWQNVSVATWGRYSTLGTSGLVFDGTNSFGDLFQLEEGEFGSAGPPAGDAIITYSTNPADGADVTVQACEFGYALHGEQDDSPAQNRIWFFSTLANAAIIPGLGGGGHWTGNDMYIESLTDGTQLYVTPGCTIQAAIDAADPGDTVNVAAGTYVTSGQIVIDKDMTVSGDPLDKPVITTSTDTGSSTDSRGWWLIEDGNRLDLDNVILDGDEASGRKVYIGILSHGHGTISDCTIRNIHYNPSGPTYQGRAIALYDSDVGFTTRVEGCTITNFGRIGVFIFGDGSDREVAGSVITGKGPGNHLDYAVEFGGGGTGSVANSTITDCRGVATVDGSTSAAIIATDYYDPGTVATITNSVLVDNAAGIFVGYALGDATTVFANYNNISGNDTGIDTVSSVLVDAEHNFWGDASGPVDTADDAGETIELGDCTITPAAEFNADGLGNGVVDTSTEAVDYCPWLDEIAAATVTLNRDDTCGDGTPGEVTVNIDLTAATTRIVGGQFFVEYNTTVFSAATIAVGDAPFTQYIYHAYGAGTIDFFVGIPTSASGATAGTMAVITLDVATGQEVCDIAGLVKFRAGLLPNELGDEDDNRITPTQVDLHGITIDTTAPTPVPTTIDSCYPTECEAEAAAITATTGTDNCSDPDDLVITASASGGCVATVTVTVTDECGNSDSSTVYDTRIDNTPPTFAEVACELDVTIECDDSTNQADTGEPTPSDNCDMASADPLTYVDVDDLSGCNGTGTITRTWTATDACGNTAEFVQIITVVDCTHPTFVDFPGNRTQDADAGLCTAVLDPAIVAPTGDDNCTVTPLVDYKRSDRANWNVGLADPYPSGTTTVSWKVTDDCGNFTVQDQTVEIFAFNEVVVNVDLYEVWGAGLSITRCITFEVFDAAPIDVDIDFTSTAPGDSASGTTTILVPCGFARTCITARDTLHTLQRQIGAPEFSIVGTQYVANFLAVPVAGNPDLEGNALVGGNLDDSQYIDIIDFAIYVNRFGVNYANGDTPCGWTPTPLGPYHADISGNGSVDTADFTFIQAYILWSSDADCGVRSASDEGPRMQIAVAELDELGLSDLAGADLNDDGWIDEQDIVAYLNGALPDEDDDDDAPVKVIGQPVEIQELEPGNLVERVGPPVRR